MERRFNFVEFFSGLICCAIFGGIFAGIFYGMTSDEEEARIRAHVERHLIENKISREEIAPIIVNVIVEPEEVSVETNSDKVQLNNIPRRSYDTKYQTSSDTKIKVWTWNGGSSVKSDQLRQTVKAVQERMSIVPSNNEGTIDLVLETSATESHRGKFVKQLNNGPARGLFQMEPKTAECLLAWLKNNHNSVYKEVVFFMNKKQDLEQNLTSNVPFQIAMTTAHYWRYLGDSMVEISSDQLNRACTWKAYYNTRLGKGDVAKYLCDAEDYL